MDPRLGWVAGAIGLLLLMLLFLSRRVPRTGVATARRRMRLATNRRRILRFRPRPANLPSLPFSPIVRVRQPPHTFASRDLRTGDWLDLSQDGRNEDLQRLGLPVAQNPDQLAAWLGVSVNRLAWLAHRFRRGKPATVRDLHYVCSWKPKRKGGLRLIESPKAQLRAVQRKILTDVLQRVAPAEAAHGFVRGRSIVTNSRPHAAKAVVLKFDLADFYASIRPRRVLNVFRRLGYSREAAIWLMRLTTSMLPGNMPIPPGDPMALWRYRGRRLPQGAPTSPALANLVAYCLDRRLAGLARSFGATYTRYADDLTFSGDESFAKGLRTFIQLVEQIVRAEGLRTNRMKRRVLRRHQRQIVAGVVVNAKPNICRRDFDRLKAILHNCVKHGPSTQNREQHPDFAAHLRGKIAHVAQLNPTRGARLRDVYVRIDWR